MKTAFIIHGTWWSPRENWFPWMKEQLESKWYRVFIPSFPTPDKQSLDAWKDTFSEYNTYIDSQTIFIAHSIWPSFVCSLLEELDTKIKACYFASGFLWFLWLHEFDILNKTFIDKDFNWDIIIGRSQYFYMCHGSDDPYVSIENAHLLAENLKVEIDMIEWWWHLNSETGYTSFEYLLEKII